MQKPIEVPALLKAGTFTPHYIRHLLLHRVTRSELKREAQSLNPKEPTNTFLGFLAMNSFYVFKEVGSLGLRYTLNHGH